MQFPTLCFALLFTATLSLCWLVRRRAAWRNTVLLIASYGFYAAWNWKLSAVLAASTLLNYCAGLLLARAQGPRARQGLLALGVALNLGLLGYFKYAGFFLESLDSLLRATGCQADLPLLQIALPLGISFFTFQGIGYLVDVAKGKAPCERNLLNFAVFSAYFPKLISGPICRAQELLPQLAQPALPGVPELNHAAWLILSGLFKKVVLAALIDGHAVSAVFDDPSNYSAAGLWAALFGYGFLLYWDFSGYTDLARGLSLLLGIRLPENFNAPYRASDIGDFWRRWHLTLSNWLRDYLFMPLANNLSSRFRPLGFRRAALYGSQLAVLITFTLCGLWHGAGWTFVLWGAYHGVLLFVHYLLRSRRWRWQGGWLGAAGTFALVSFGWLLFRSADLPAAGLFLTRMLSPRAAGQGAEVLGLVLILGGIALHGLESPLRRGLERATARLPLPISAACWFTAGMAILALMPKIVPEYIYSGF